jgi:hypothetical protein
LQCVLNLDVDESLIRMSSLIGSLLGSDERSGIVDVHIARRRVAKPPTSDGWSQDGAPPKPGDSAFTR